jgi:hypothetical protein
MLPECIFSQFAVVAVRSTFVSKAIVRQGKGDCRFADQRKTPQNTDSIAAPVLISFSWMREKARKAERFATNQRAIL